MKRFDPHADLFYQYVMAKKQCQALGSAYRSAEKREKELRKLIVSKMGKSTYASIEGVPVFELGTAGRDSVTVGRVREYAPIPLQKVLIQHITWDTIRLIKGEQDG